MIDQRCKKALAMRGFHIVFPLGNCRLYAVLSLASPDGFLRNCCWPFFNSTSRARQFDGEISGFSAELSDFAQLRCTNCRAAHNWKC